jgi:light-regulated signal transduction histidine kinase (bacteriophytochrome)
VFQHGLGVDLSNVTTRCIQDLREETRGREIVWKPAQLPVVSADFTLLRPVFVNLISNAIQVHAPATRRKLKSPLPAKRLMNGPSP